MAESKIKDEPLSPEVVIPEVPKVETPQPVPIEKPSYIDVSKFAPKAEGYTPETENKKLFDFIQDRYRSGSLDVAPGYTFYSNDPRYNDELMENYKKRYPEVYAEFMKNADAASYTPKETKKIKNEHPLAGFWDYAAGRQEQDNLKNLYMYGFKSDDERATPEIMERLKEENPWLWEEYQKNLADQQNEKTLEGQEPALPEMPPMGDGGPVLPDPEPPKKKGPKDILDALGKMGVSLAEIVNAAALGKAGITDPNQLAYGRRQAKEAKAAETEAEKQAKAEERAWAEKMELKRQEYETKNILADQNFRTAAQEREWSQAEKTNAAEWVKKFELAGFDRATALMLADKELAKGGAQTQPTGDPLGLGTEKQSDLDKLFDDGKITEEQKAKAEKTIKEQNLAKAQQTMSNIIPASSQPAAQKPPAGPTVPTKDPLVLNPPVSTKQLTLKQQGEILKKQGWTEYPGSGGKVWQLNQYNAPPLIKKLEG